MRILRDVKILCEESGAAALEAALVLPFYITFIFAIIEFGQIYWQYNSIQYIADETARCSAISGCNVVTTAYQSAANIWPSSSAAGNEISVNSTATCGDYSGTQVTIVHTVNSLTGFFPNVMPLNIGVQSCYPKPS
jgi:Flp pilus assembly protein TadG